MFICIYSYNYKYNYKRTCIHVWPPVRSQLLAGSTREQRQAVQAKLVLET